MLPVRCRLDCRLTAADEIAPCTSPETTSARRHQSSRSDDTVVGTGRVAHRERGMRAILWMGLATMLACGDSFWGKYSADGTASVAGADSSCYGCHESGQDCVKVTTW